MRRTPRQRRADRLRDEKLGNAIADRVAVQRKNAEGNENGTALVSTQTAGAIR